MSLTLSLLSSKLFFFISGISGAGFMGVRNQGEGRQNFLSGLLKGFVTEEEITFASFLSAPVMWMVASGRPAFWVAELGRTHRNTRPAKGKGKTSCEKPVNEFKKA